MPAAKAPKTDSKFLGLRMYASGMPELTRRRLLAGAIAVGVLRLTSIAAAQNVARVGPGTRLVWVGGAASIPGEREQIEPDVNGEWVNKETGERYSGFETPGAAGAGFIVIDVLAADAGGIVLWVSTLLTHADFGGTSTFIDANGLVGDGRNIADYWISPAELGGLADRDDASLRVLRMPYQIDGQYYRAIRIQSEGGAGWSQNTYDLDSGICIATGSTTQGGPVLTLGLNNTITPGIGSTQLTFTRFAGARETSLPGAAEVFPNGMRNIRTLNYSGTKVATMPGGGDFSVPVQVRYDVTSNPGPYLTARLSVAGTIGPQERVIAAGVIGSLWMNPRTLGNYSPGEVLDDDPITGVRAVSLGRDGNRAVVALQTGLAQHSFTYDLESGLLTRADLRQQIGITTDVLTVDLVGLE